MKLLKIAIEYERALHSATDFTLTNLAPHFLSHPANTNGDGKYFHPEGALSQTEYNSLPTSSLHNLCHELLKGERISRHIGNDLGLVNIPVSENGAGASLPNPAMGYRLNGYRVLFGEDFIRKIISISGQHLHIDRYMPRFTDQFNFNTALIPTIAFTSTSPLSYRREHSLNCHRYRLIAHPQEGMFALIPEERGYISSPQELAKRDQDRHRKWKEAFARNSAHLTDLLPDYNFDQAFPVERTGYADIRNRPNMGVGTFEVRIHDAAPLNIALAQAALVLGINNRIILQQIPVEISPREEVCVFDPTKVILPNRETLAYYTQLAVERGLEARPVRAYLTILENFARGGLSEAEQQYLDPLVEMLDSQSNIASQILQHLGSKPEYSAEEAAKANRFVWNRHLQGIQSLQEKLRKGMEKRP